MLYLVQDRDGLGIYRTMPLFLCQFKHLLKLLHLGYYLKSEILIKHVDHNNIKSEKGTNIFFKYF